MSLSILLTCYLFIVFTINPTSPPTGNAIQTENKLTPAATNQHKPGCIGPMYVVSNEGVFAKEVLLARFPMRETRF